MHQAQRDFCTRVKENLPEYFSGVSVIDFGSLNINGDNRYLFNDYIYTGVDIGEGTNVDVVCRASQYKPKEKVDVVISTEMLEHDEQWKESLLNMVQVLKSGGLLILTCATTGRPEHGTSRKSPGDAPFTNNYYGNRTEEDLREVWDMDVFESYSFEWNKGTHDLYFWGIVK